MKKVLVVFGEGSKKNVLIESALFFKEKLGYEITPLYIRDVRRDEIIPATMDGMIVNLSNNSFSEERDALEEEELKHLQEKLRIRGIINPLNVEFGFPWDIIKEYLKLSDMLMFEKGEILSESAVTVLKNHFKPVIMIGEKPITKLEKIGISSDDGVKINRSVFSFINLFPQKKDFTMLTLLYNMEENKLLKYLKERDKDVVFKSFDGEAAKDKYLEEIKNLDLLIMGNLSRGYFFEKITGKKGLSIMEKSEVSIFIG
ncbi:hypothetical protein [uncultured Cetobacterium sp.]|uniref:hypothetical protein n=1 Tax=uncultured Cetobacterium sp. TaxID=527638 RepID=UPI0026221BC9|nr:hypothetical protein [uncultured Cetobacterium sp.]